jgi:RHS repeat-associated protein
VESPERLTNFDVFVSDVPFTSTNLTTTINQAGVSSYQTTGQCGFPTELAINRTGRYVRVQLAGTNYLSIAELQVFTGSTTPSVQWLISDQLGTPRMVLDQTGSLANMKRHDYLPFGEELVAPISGRSAAQGYAGGDGVRKQFTGKERDVETGLDYFYSRYYSATQGRFTSPDILLGQRGNPQTLNRYAYVMNNPLRYVDPLGYQAQDRPKDDKIDVIVIVINDQEQQRRLREEEERKKRFLPRLVGGFREYAKVVGHTVASTVEYARHVAQVARPDGLTVNATALWVVSVDLTITADFDVLGGIDVPIYSGWTAAAADGLKGKPITPKSGLGISVTQTHILNRNLRTSNGEIITGDNSSAQKIRHSFYGGTSWGASGCYIGCGGVQIAGQNAAVVTGIGTPGGFVGASQSGYLFHIPVEKVPNPFTYLRELNQ